MERLLTFGCLLAFAPAVASAALDLRIGPNSGADRVDAAVAPGSGEDFFDVSFTATGDSETFNELLFVYDLAVETARPGIRLLRVEKPDNWVFTAPDATLEILVASPVHILVRGTDTATGFGSDIITGSEVARVFYAVDEGAAPGVYRIAVDRYQTVFGTGNPNCSCNIFPDFNDAGVVLVTPEPSGLALLGAGAAFALRRRRTV